MISGCTKSEQNSIEISNLVEPTMVDDTKMYNITGDNYNFIIDGKKAPTLKVNKGDKVKIAFTSKEGFHDWVVDELNVYTERVRSGEGTISSTSVEFIADTKGTFEYYCSVGKHRENGMIGIIIVE